MNEIQKQIERIMSAPVSGLLKLSDNQFELVMLIIRVRHALEVKPVKAKVKK